MPVDRSALAALVAEVRRTHTDYSPASSGRVFCRLCEIPWPCKAIQLTDSVDALLAEGAEDTRRDISYVHHVVADPSVPEGEIHFRNAEGKIVGKITNAFASAAARPPAAPASPAAGERT